MAKITKRYKIGAPTGNATEYVGTVLFVNGWAEVEVDIDDAPLGELGVDSLGVPVVQSGAEELALLKNTSQGAEAALKLRVMRAAPAMAYFWPQGYIVTDENPDVMPGNPPAAAKAAAKSKETPA